MPELHYPTSDVDRLEVLRNAKERLDQVDSADVVLTAATVTRLNELLPQWDQEVRERDVAAGTQSETADAVRHAAAVLRMYISHFLQAFNNAVARGEFNPAERAHFQLPTSQDSLPSLSSEDDLVTWAGRLSQGEADRIAAALAPVTMPPIVSVAAKLTAFQTARTARDSATDQVNKEAEDVTNLRDDVDEFIREDLWYEVLSAYRKEESPATLRRKARLWSVRYRFRSGETPEAGELDELEAPVEPPPV